eukprot:sb/3469252/
MTENECSGSNEKNRQTSTRPVRSSIRDPKANYIFNLLRAKSRLIKKEDNGQTSEKAGRSDGSSGKLRRKKGVENNSRQSEHSENPRSKSSGKRQKDCPKKQESMKRKRDVRKTLKEAREELAPKDVLDCTPLRGIKKATDLSFLGSISPISFDTPKKKRRKKKPGEQNITPTNRDNADRYLVQLQRRLKNAPKCEVPSQMVKNNPSQSQVFNIDEVLDEETLPTDDEEVLDEYFE